MAHLLGITAAGAVTSLLFAARAAVTFIPKAVAEAAAPTDTSAPVDEAAAEEATNKRNAGLAFTVLAAIAPLALTKHNPAAYGDMMTIPAGLAWSVLGWLVAKDWKESGVPGAFLLNPMVAGALSANLGVMWHGKLAGYDWLTGMHQYLGQVGLHGLLWCVEWRAQQLITHRNQLTPPGWWLSQVGAHIQTCVGHAFAA